MTDFLQYLIAGIAVGCTYAMLGSGFVMIYRVTQVVNLAQGTFAVLGGFFTYSLLGHGLPHGVAEVIGAGSGSGGGAVRNDRAQQAADRAPYLAGDHTRPRARRGSSGSGDLG